jgi:hypothetical protein
VAWRPGPTPFAKLEADPLRVTGVFVGAAAVLLAIVYGLVLGLGLPTWVVVAAAILLAAGLPVALATSVAERRRSRGALTGAPNVLTWRRTLAGGGLAFAGLALVTVGYTAARALGIGPAGSLIATGAISEREPLILADFENRTADTAHVATVTELGSGPARARSPTAQVPAAAPSARVSGRQHRLGPSFSLPGQFIQPAVLWEGRLRFLFRPGSGVPRRRVTAEEGRQSVLLQQPQHSVDHVRHGLREVVVGPVPEM